MRSPSEFDPNVHPEYGVLIGLCIAVFTILDTIVCIGVALWILKP